MLLSKNGILMLSARWGLLAAAVAAAFWGIWSLFADVPSVHFLPYFLEQGLYQASRWWDILGVFLWMSFFATAIHFSKSSDESNEKDALALSVSFSTGILLGFFIGVIVGFLPGILYGLLIALAEMTLLYLLATIKQIALFIKDAFCGAYKGMMEKPDEPKVKVTQS